MALALRRGIRAERARTGMSQVEFAEALGDGWSRQIVAAIETGARRVWAQELPDLCRVLGVTLEQLLDRADPEDRAALGL